MVLQKIASSTARATSGIRTMSAASAAASRLRKLPEFRVELAPQAVSAAGEGQQHGVASYGRFLFGRGQVILARGRSKKRKRGGDGETARAVFWAGSDPRGDGMAVGY